MIDELKVQGWRCLKDVRVELTPLHALIGPNDSGKSTILEAFRLVCQGSGPGTIGAGFSITAGGRALSIRMGAGGHEHTASVNGRATGVHEILDAVGPTASVRLDADELRKPSRLVQDPLVRLSERGNGLPGVYDAILNRDRDAWDAIERDLQAAFPTVRRLALKVVSDAEKMLEVELQDLTRVDANAMSEGLLYWLAFAARPYLAPVKLLLVEEPENGLHPARIAQVVAILRALSEKGTQVLLATHSPLVVNELKPEEVSVVTRTVKEGTRVRRATSIPDLKQLESVFSLGELWLSYANGTDEAGLFESKRPSS